MKAAAESVCQQRRYADAIFCNVSPNPFDSEAAATDMTKDGDYRRNAAETIELASRAASTGDKGHLLALAEKWLDLADRAHRLTRRFGATQRNHPLVDAKLGDRTDAQ